MSVDNCRATLCNAPEEQGISFTPWRNPEINFCISLPQIIFTFLETRHALYIVFFSEKWVERKMKNSVYLIKFHVFYLKMFWTKVIFREIWRKIISNSVKFTLICVSHNGDNEVSSLARFCVLSLWYVTVLQSSLSLRTWNRRCHDFSLNILTTLLAWRY